MPRVALFLGFPLPDYMIYEETNISLALERSMKEYISLFRVYV